MSETQNSHIAKLLLAWYDQYGRSLPWRLDRDPYKVWISEIMLQQTRVETVIPYFSHWMKIFPSLSLLASATQQEVLQIWEGLGYYSRARNIHQTARIIVEKYNGSFPGEPKELTKLPGIGNYTAAAIASIAFDKDEAALDGNIRRVYSRLFNISEPARSKESEKRLAHISQELLPEGRAGDFNQALMDLGAMICTPRKPACETCPLSQLCQSYSLGLQEQRPVKTSRKAIPHLTVTAAVIFKDDKVLIAQRPQNGLLGGLWEFPGGKLEPGEDLTGCLKREIKEELDMPIHVGSLLGTYHHTYTHFQVTLHAFYCRIKNGSPTPIEASQICWVKPDNLSDYPMGKIDRQISMQLYNLAKAQSDR